MKIKNFTIKAMVLASVLLTFVGCGKTTSVDLVSPDGLLKTNVSISDVDGSMSYQVSYENAAFVAPSALGFTIKGGENVSDGMEILNVETISVDTTWIPPYGDRSQYVDKYNGVKLTLGRKGEPALYDMEFRAYNEGVAYRYIFNKDGVEYATELSEMNVDPNSTVWGSVASQSEISECTLKDLTVLRERPFVGKLPNGNHFALGEAAQINYPRGKFKFNKASSTLNINLEGDFVVENLKTSPWRYMIAGKKIGDMLEKNFLLLNLNEPCAVENPKRFEPGKVIRDVTLTTAGGKACIDFAAKHGIKYVIESAGWYGNEFSKEADAATITPDPTRSKGHFDLHEIIKYGKEKGVKIMVYVNRNQLEKQLDQILPLYQKWGIEGIKYGFVRTGSQKASAWNFYQIEQAAKYGMVLSIHDDFRPTGYQRTYPNWMTAEGIRGDEETPSNSHTVSTVLTRGVSGPGDNTVCYFAERVKTMGSHASQMAKVVCIYSPMQWLYWYDRPVGAPLNTGGAGGHESIIKEIPDLKFFDEVPTVWDDIKVIEGSMAEYVTIARRSGDDWYIGSINGEKDHQVKFALDFLTKGKKYVATTYSDDASLKTETNIKIEDTNVDASTVINRKVLSNNGFVMQIKMVK